MANQNPMEAFKAQGLPEHPVGTVDELQKHKLPQKVFRACCEPSPDGTPRGCQHFYKCDMSYKGLSAEEGGGPRNHCWERIKSAANGGGIVRNIQPCFWGVAQQDIALENNEILRPIADEGEEFEQLTTIPLPEKGSNQFGALAYEERLVKKVVTPFERLGKAKDMARHELRAKVMDDAQKRAANAKRAKLLGAVESGNEPLDRRGQGSSRSPKKEG